MAWHLAASKRGPVKHGEPIGIVLIRRPPTEALKVLQTESEGQEASSGIVLQVRAAPEAAAVRTTNDRSFDFHCMPQPRECLRFTDSSLYRLS
jgi:hypothetical protein